MFLGIDIGTSAVKACVIDADCTAQAVAQSDLSISHPHPGWSEQNPADWWAAVSTAVNALWRKTPDLAPQISAIGLSGQMHGAVLLDKDGTVIRPAILWNDGRSSQPCRVLGRDPSLAQIAGVRPMAGFTAPKLMWLRDHAPDQFDRIAYILLPKDYVGFMLHGQFATDPCDASGTFLYDIGARRWSGTLCGAAGVAPDMLPQVYDGTEVVGALQGKAADELGLGAGLPVVAGAGDAAAGAVGIGAVSEGLSFLSLGTSGQYFVPSAAFRPAPEMGLHSYAHAVPDMWFQMAAMLNGARPMDWFATVANRPLPELLGFAEQVDADRIPLFLPYLTGERTPHGDDAIRGAFYGLGNDTAAPEMMRAVVDAIAYSFADAQDAIGAVTQLPDQVLAIGGGSKSDLVLQTLADVLGITIARPVGGDKGPAVGAAKLAAVAGGALTLRDLAQQPDIAARFTPSQDAARHVERLEQYRALYAALKPLSR